MKVANRKEDELKEASDYCKEQFAGGQQKKKLKKNWIKTTQTCSNEEKAEQKLI